MDRKDIINTLLTEKLRATQVSVIDESHLHAGHVGARSGKGHFAVTVQSPLFRNLTTIKRHRLIYKTLATLMDTDIHALSIVAKTPEE